MLFNSYIFILLFLPLCLAGYFFLQKNKRDRSAKVWLTGMSLWFYAYFNPYYLLIILASIGVNFAVYRLITRAGDRKKTGYAKAAMAAGVAANLGILFYFKYYDFFLENLNGLFAGNFALKHILLPLGISFFTFQQVGFLVDAYRGEAEGYSFLDYALFVTFFPQLIAGPIVTHSEMIPQFQDPSRKRFDRDCFAQGCFIFTLGLTKKVLLADTLGRGADWAFSNFGRVNAAGTVIMMLSYTLQLYFDFSGYCDMARGIGRMFRIDIPINFNSPYKAVDLIDFWKRWHITLSRFFTQYVYIPLGGSRKGKVRTYVNIFMVYLLSGLWHGAGWTYIAWGTLHGVVYVLNRLFYTMIHKIPRVILWTGNMLFFIFSLIFFRSASMEQAADVIGTIGTLDFSIRGIPAEMAACYQMEELWYPLRVLGIDRLPYSQYYMMFFLIAAGWLIVLCFQNVNQMAENWKPRLRSAVVCGGLLVWNVISFAGVSSFLYFNF